MTPLETTEFILRAGLILVAVKAFTVGSPYNFAKRIKEGKAYSQKYNEWMKNKP